MKADSFWAGLPLGRGVTVLARDANGIAALSKPAGVLSHPNEPKDNPRSLLTAAYAIDEECYDLPELGGKLWLLNRLDSATSGVILVASNSVLAASVRAQFKRHQVRKTYNALVFGKLHKAEETWRNRLAVERKSGKIRAGQGHIPSESRVSVVRYGSRQPALTLLKLEPLTGRSHQLRVQCAEHHLPIVGDQTYGDFRKNREFAKATGSKRLFLHSLETRFTYEFSGKAHSFSATAALPPDFEAFL